MGKIHPDLRLSSQRDGNAQRGHGTQWDRGCRPPSDTGCFPGHIHTIKHVLYLQTDHHSGTGLCPGGGCISVAAKAVPVRTQLCSTLGFTD